MHPAAEKSALRTAAIQRLQAMTAEHRIAESRSVCRRLVENKPKDAARICLFTPMPTEVDVRPFTQHLLNEGCIVYLPRTEGRDFTFRRIRDQAHMTKGPHGVLEPDASGEEVALDAIDWVILPGLAFDASGRRLGRGNGGYDRWLARLRKENTRCLITGICFDCQIFPSIVCEPHDVRVDTVIVPRGKWDARAGA